MNVNRLAAGLAGLIVSTTLVAVPVLASASNAGSAGTDSAVAPAAALSARCATESAAAAATPSLAAAKAVGDCEVDRRLATIATLKTGIGDSAKLTAGHKTTLDGILDTSATGLPATRVKIDADTTIAAVRADNRSVFDDYRIYVLVSRQVALVRGDDAVGAAVTRLTAAATKIQAAITKAQTGGKNVTEATTQLAAMQAAIAAAQSAVAGDTDAVLALTPAQWNAGSAAPVLDAARASIKTARSSLATALADGKAAMAALK